jgi:hypothetical protein
MITGLVTERSLVLDAPDALGLRGPVFFIDDSVG